MSYTSSKAQTGLGTLFYIGPVVGTSSPTYVLVAEIDEIGPSSRTWGTQDSTNFQSPIDMEFLKTMRDPGGWDFSGNKVPTDAGQQALQAAMDSLANYLFKLVFPVDTAAGQATTGDTVVFSAGVLEFDPNKISPKDIIKFTCKLKQSGSRTYTPGA